MQTLPYVSRRALRRVRDPLPVPESCPYCDGTVELVNNSEVYGREYGRWPYAYLCRPCNAYVGLHPDTDLPLGTLADKDLREARKQEKVHFEKLHGGDRESRTQAYSWLAKAMGINTKHCHWGWFNLEQCRVAGALCRAKEEGK